MTSLLITRPLPENQQTADRLAKIGISSVLMPFLSFQPINAILPPRQKFAALAITSGNALRALKELGLLDNVLHLPLFAVGEKTAREARAAGFLSVTVANNSVTSLADCIKTVNPGGPILYPSAKHRSGDLGALLGPFGINVTCLPVYQMIAKTTLTVDQISLLQSNKIQGVMFYSSRTARIFIDACDNSGLDNKKRLHVLCLSKKVVTPLLEAGYCNTLVADAPNEDAMMALALSFAQSGRK